MNVLTGQVPAQRFHSSGKGQKVANYFAAGITPPEMKLDPTAYIRAAPGCRRQCAQSGDEMKFRTIAFAVVLMLVSTVAFAQSGGQNSNQTAEKKGEQAAQSNPF